MKQAVKLASIAAAVLFTLIGGAARPAWSKPICAPAAMVNGPPEIVDPVRAIVAAHGVRVVIDAACRSSAVRAQIARHRDRGGFTLTTVDGAGRASTRAFVDAETAASLIESWALDEDGPLLAPPSPIAPVPATPVDSSPATPIARTMVNQHADARLHFLAGAETSLASDGSWWYGANLAACVRVGALCLGAGVRSIRDTDLGGATGTDSVERTNIDGLVTASWLMRAGAVILAPTVAVGAGWLRTRTEGGLPENAIVRNDRNLRTELSLLARWPISPRVALAAELGASWSPWARSNEQLEQRALLPGEPAGRLRLGLLCAVTP